VVRIVGVLYLLAPTLLLIETFGLFDQERDLLAAMFLMPQGVPWAVWPDGVGEAFKPWPAALAPALNLLLLSVACRFAFPSNDFTHSELKHPSVLGRSCYP
jgi:hypothetical protein